MQAADRTLMHDEIHEIPEMIMELGILLAGQQPFAVKRVLVVGYGSNLNAAKVLERSLAERGIGMRFATPQHAVLLDGEALVCITRSAANDDVMKFLTAHQSERKCLLMTATVDSENVQNLTESVRVAPLTLGSVRPAVATQSIFAVIMVLDCLLSSDVDERLQLWRDFSIHLKRDLPAMSLRAQGRARTLALAKRLFVIGDEVMEDVGTSICLTMMEVANVVSLPVPLRAGSRGPIMKLGAGDLALLLGNGPDELFRHYRAAAHYSLHLTSPDDVQGIAAALYALAEGQLLALELSTWF